MKNLDQRQNVPRPLRTLRAAASLCAVLLLALSCSGPESETPAAVTSSRAKSLTSRPFDSVEFGAIHGEVRYTGDAPERFRLGAHKKAECATHAGVEHLSERVVAADGRLGGVLVRITRGVDPGMIPDPPGAPAVLDQRGCIYTPHVLGLQVGQSLEVRNSDPATHNVNARTTKNRRPGNRNMGAGQPPMSIEFEHPELSIKFKCDIHPWMEARVHVLAHPWFAVTLPDGTFTIPDVPPGTYTIETLHEVYGRLSKSNWVVKAGSSTGFALTYDL